jgi:hypothetical protein
MFLHAQRGAERCELSPGEAIVVVHVPVRVTEEGPMPDANLRYCIGAFRGRETKLLVVPGQSQATLTFRIPQERFQPPEPLALEAYAKSKEGKERTLWTARYEVGWKETALRSKPFLVLSKD